MLSYHSKFLVLLKELVDYSLRDFLTHHSGAYIEGIISKANGLRFS